MSTQPHPKTYPKKAWRIMPVTEDTFLIRPVLVLSLDADRKTAMLKVGARKESDIDFCHTRLLGSTKEKVLEKLAGLMPALIQPEFFPAAAAPASAVPKNGSDDRAAGGGTNAGAPEPQGPGPICHAPAPIPP